MRALKFRMWEWNLMKYFDLDDVYYNIVQPSNGVNEPPIMQFTGLNDKNGKGIYEGDILASSNHDPEYDIWEKDELGYTTVYWSERYDGWRGSKWQWGKDDESSYGLPFVEVIGNIYETPHLGGDQVER